MAKQAIILRHKHALGDTVCFTALARDIQLIYPGRFDVFVDTYFKEVWNNNPHARVVSTADRRRRPKPIHVDISYRNGIVHAGRGNKVHMISWFHRDFAHKTGMTLPLLKPHGDLHLQGAECDPVIEGRYWVVMAGAKLDITNKFWWYQRYQSVVDALRERGIYCVQAGVLHRDHRHGSLNGALNMVNKLKSSREFFNLIQHADGVICPVTSAMHIAACYHKPCVVISGGREEPWWEAYANAYDPFGPQCEPIRIEHRFLHTVGQLSCCKKKGCWRKRTVPINRGDKRNNKDPCVSPVAGAEQHIAQCMDMITADHVVEAVMSYYKDGSIPPIGQPKKDPEDDEFEEPKLVDPSKIPLIIKNPPKPRSKPPVPAVAALPARVPAPRAVKVPKPKSAPPADRMKILDHPTIGGKLTVFVLCYGPYTNLAESCLGSILDTVPVERLDIRVACNEVVPATLDYLRTLPITKLYINGQNRKKYPVMREMFWDDTCPINTKYVLWFDDDTKIVDPNWLVRLSETIVAQHGSGHRMFGTKLIHDLKLYAKNGHRPDQWFRSASWFNGRHFRMRRKNMEAPNGTVIEFAVGYFWALALETIRRGNIPDPRLNHNGGDITIGEQVHQTGAGIRMFNKDKVFVWCPKKEDGGRRGFQENFPWTKRLVQDPR
jgi:hypothetical protein